MPSIVEIGRRHAVHYEKMLGALFEIYKLSGILGAGLFDVQVKTFGKPGRGRSICPAGTEAQRSCAPYFPAAGQSCSASDGRLPDSCMVCKGH